MLDRALGRPGKGARKESGENALRIAIIGSGGISRWSKV